jgi:6-phospho-beta-glucosidase
VRLTVVGGGGFRVPLVYGAVATPGSGVDEVVLYDEDPRRLAVVRAVCTQLAAGAEAAPRLVTTTDLDEAVDGAGVVFSAMRVGGLGGRVADEQVALEAGVVGQETTGAGGVAYGLRTVPVAVRLARRVAARAPDAWVVNFTNPAGLVTEAMARVLGDRVVGVCDSPVALGRRVVRALGVDPARAWCDYAGLNHLGWLRAVVVDGRDLLPSLLADDAALAAVEEGRLFGGDWLRTLGAVPNEYLYYYDFRAEAVAAMRAAPRTRGEYLRDQQEGFYTAVADDPATALDAWRRARAEREATYMAESRRAGDARDAADLDGGGYEGVALALMRALTGAGPATLVLDVRNRGALAGLDDDAVVEVPCHVDATGTHPVTVAPLAADALGLVQTVKAVERTTIEAALTGSRALAVRALARHPLVGSVPLARRLLDGYTARVPALADVLAR